MIQRLIKITRFHLRYKLINKFSMSQDEFKYDQEEEKMEAVMTAKEIKKKFRPEF